MTVAGVLRTTQPTHTCFTSQDERSVWTKFVPVTVMIWLDWDGTYRGTTESTVGSNALKKSTLSVLPR
jgi:hypothetical protein